MINIIWLGKVLAGWAMGVKDHHAVDKYSLSMTYLHYLCYVVTPCQVVITVNHIAFLLHSYGHMDGALDITVPSFGNSVIRGLATSGQWSAAGSTVYRRESHFIICQHIGYVVSPNLLSAKAPSILPRFYC